MSFKNNGSDKKRSGPKVFEKNKVIEVPFEEDPFENAIKENEKIEKKLEKDKLKLIEFNKKVKERIRAYKFAERQLEQDAQLVIHKKNVMCPSKKNFLDKSKSKSIFDLSEGSKSGTTISLSEENLSNFALKTIENETHKREQYKKRIKSTRKIYSNMERDKIRNESFIKNLKSDVSKTEPRSSQKTKLETKKIKLEKSDECLQMRKDETIIKELEIFANEQHRDNEKKKPEPRLILRGKKTEPNLEKYICYLREIAKEKSIPNKLEIPPICQCHLNSKNNAPIIWDMDFTKCANNCLFYKNPKGICLKFLI